MMLMLSSVTICSLSKCKSDDQCMKWYSGDYRCESHICIRKQYTYQTKELIGFASIIIISLITNSGGVGAGTVVIPAYTAFFNFVSSDAIHLSRITIFAGAFVNFIINWKKRDSNEKDRLLIDYNMASVMIPLHLAGAECGVLFGKFLPPVIVTIILFLLLIVSIIKTYQRGKNEIRKEISIKPPRFMAQPKLKYENSVAIDNFRFLNSRKHSR